MVNSSKQKGFTLIELIIVIIILGILAVTAAPKFLDLGSDATESTMDGIRGALETASQLARSKGRIDGVNDTDVHDGTTDATITIDGSTVALDEGVAAPFAANIDGLLDIDAETNRASATAAVTNDFVIVQDNADNFTSNTVRIYPADKIRGSFTGTFDATATCYVQYTYDPTGAATTPTISQVSTTC